MRGLELKIPPLALVLLTAALMWLSARTAPTFTFVIPLRNSIAVAIALLGAATSILGVVSFRRAGTTVNPLTPAASSSLVRSGIYTRSRNPMCLGFLLLLLGWGIYLSNAVSLLFIPVFVGYMNRFQIEPEENALRNRFGQELAYNRSHNAIGTARMCRVRKGSGMAKLVFGMNQSLDGYVDHMAFAPSPTLFRHFIEEAQGQAGSVYGRQMYEVMRYWDDDHPEWDAEEHAFAAAWRNQPKWVVSRSLKSVGPNARLVEDDLEGAIRELKAERDGEIEVAGPDLAQSLTELGLIDEYRIYLHPVVLGHGKPYFAGPRPPLRLMANDRIGEDVIRLAYVPA